jgi:hypothetical protein
MIAHSVDRVFEVTEIDCENHEGKSNFQIN